MLQTPIPDNDPAPTFVPIVFRSRQVYSLHGFLARLETRTRLVLCNLCHQHMCPAATEARGLPTMSHRIDQRCQLGGRYGDDKVGNIDSWHLTSSTSGRVKLWPRTGSYVFYKSHFASSRPALLPLLLLLLLLLLFLLCALSFPLPRPDSEPTDDWIISISGHHATRQGLYGEALLPYARSSRGACRSLDEGEGTG